MRERRAAVIGAGFGGLAAAIRLQAAGVETVLLDRRDRPGGRGYVYEDEGFVFDAGPTVITAPEALEELFALAEQRMADHVALEPVRPFYRLYWEDGFQFDYSNDLAETRRQIAATCPADVAGYERFLAYTAEVFAEGYVKLAHVPFLDFRSMVRVAPQLLRLQAFRSVYDIVARFISDPHLRQAFSFHSLLVGGNPYTTSAIYTLIHHLERRWGVFYPRGGTGALVRALTRLFEELGGEVVLGCDVSRIETDRRSVRAVVSHDGWRKEVDVVVSNADVVHTYGMLLRDEPLAAGRAARLAKRRHSMSLFVAYFGTRRQHPHLAHHSVCFGPRYRELLTDVFERGVLANDFSLYLHAPTRTDPSLAPPGCEAFYVLSPVPHLGKAPIDWAEEGPRYASRILEYLERRHIPGLTDDLVTLRTFTPSDFRDVLNAHHGSAFSLEPILSQSAYFRVHNRDPKIGGLYFVGAGTHPGAGVPGVVSSAKATASLVLADLGMANGSQ